MHKKLPNAVKQTRPTNCFQACVATVLGLPITDVPDACDGASWDWDAFQNWLATKGMQAIEITFENGGTIYPVTKPVLCIITGESPRGGRHALVAEYLGFEGFNLLFDPHDENLWINGEPTHAVFFVPLELSLLKVVDVAVEALANLVVLRAKHNDESLTPLIIQLYDILGDH